MKNLTKMMLLSLVTIALMTQAYAGKLAGRVYSDYYTYSKSHDATYKGQYGLNFRRIYLTYKNKLENDWSMKFRYEMNGGKNNAVTPSKLSPVVKDMYLAKKFGDHKVYFGISNTPTFELMEGNWGYRSVEKSPLDLYKMRSSRDTGIALKGQFGAMVDYHFMMGNNSSTSQETNKYKLYALSVVLHPMSNIDLELYTDTGDSFDKQTDSRSSHVFLSWQGENDRAGFMYSSDSKKDTGIKYKATVMSVYAVHKLCDKMSVFARYDNVKYDDANAATGFKTQTSYLPINADAKEFSTIIAGLDYKASKNVSIIPNVEMVNYSKAFATKTTDTNDLVSRVTFAYKF